MSIYHLHCQIIGRSNGQSAVASAAYRSTSQMTDNETGIVCDYTRKEKALNSFILTPEGSPDWTKDRAELWNKVHEKESRKNSQLAYSYDVALPHEIADDEKMIRAFLKKNFTDRGLIVDANKHAPHRGGDKKNVHWHFQITTRTITPDGWGDKLRIGENKLADRQGWLNEIRQSWQDVCNEELKRIGSEERIDCRTLEAQGEKRTPTQHQGPTAAAMERRGKKPNRTKEKKMETYIEPKEKNVNVEFAEIWKANPKYWEEKENAEKIRLANLSDTEFKKEYEHLRPLELNAQALAVRDLLPEIRRSNISDTEKIKKDMAEHAKHEPEKLWSKPNSIKNFFMEWRSSDGKVHKTYEEYENKQSGLISEFHEKQKALEDTDKELFTEENLIKKVDSEKTKKDADSINAALKLGYNQKYRRPNLFEKIKEKTGEFLNMAREFLGYQHFKNLLSEVQAARDETARQNRVRTRGNEPDRGHHW